MIIISCYDLLDSWGSNLLSLWPSGHGLFNMLNFTSMHYRSTKLDWPEDTMSITINWLQSVENVHKTELASLFCRQHFYWVIRVFVSYLSMLLQSYYIIHKWVHSSTSSFLLLCSSWGLYRSVTCCTVLWVNAALLRSPPWSHFAPSRQSVLSPECAVLLGVSCTTLWLLLRSSTPLGIY